MAYGHHRGKTAPHPAVDLDGALWVSNIISKGVSMDSEGLAQQDDNCMETFRRDERCRASELLDGLRPLMELQTQELVLLRKVEEAARRFKEASDINYYWGMGTIQGHGTVSLREMRTAYKDVCVALDALDTWRKEHGDE